MRKGGESIGRLPGLPRGPATETSEEKVRQVGRAANRRQAYLDHLLPIWLVPCKRHCPGLLQWAGAEHVPADLLLVPQLTLALHGTLPQVDGHITAAVEHRIGRGGPAEGGRRARQGERKQGQSGCECQGSTLSNFAEILSLGCYSFATHKHDQDCK